MRSLQKNAFCLGLVASLCMASKHSSAADVPVPDTSVSSLRFSAMVLNTMVPALSCIVTGPADMAATIAVLVLLFEKSDSPDPYAQVAGSATISPANPRGSCDINNGQQTVPPITPAKIEIQVSSTIATIAANVAVVLLKRP